MMSFTAFRYEGPLLLDLLTLSFLVLGFWRLSDAF